MLDYLCNMYCSNKHNLKERVVINYDQLYTTNQIKGVETTVVQKM